MFALGSLHPVAKGIGATGDFQAEGDDQGFYESHLLSDAIHGTPRAAPGINIHVQWGELSRVCTESPFSKSLNSKLVVFMLDER